jgi:hypothetical protein
MMNNESSCLEINGFIFDDETVEMWEKASRGEISVEDARKIAYEKVEKWHRKNG